MKNIFKILGIIMLVMMITIGTASCASNKAADTTVETEATEDAASEE